MLQRLEIIDFILIEKLELDFDQGFCVITGETGAGKSILLDSILFCLGSKLSNDPVRPQAEFCSVILVFDNDETTNAYLESAGIIISDNLIIRTTQKNNGRKTFAINDQIVTIKLVQGLFDYLLELHGQHNHTQLLNIAYHGEILDEFGKLHEFKNIVSQNYYKWQESKQEILKFESNREKIVQEIDYLKHICEELEQANIKEGEEQELVDIKRKLQTYDKEKKLAKALTEDIENISIERLIAKIQKSISTSENPASLQKISADLEAAYDKIEDAKSSLYQLLQDIDNPEFSLEEIDDRLYEIRSLARKHHCSVNDLDNFLKKSLDRLELLNEQVKNNSTVKQNVVIFEQKYYELANELSEKRKKLANILSDKVMSELSSLDMKKAIFKIEVVQNMVSPSAKGIDNIYFTASTNPGMSLSSIDKVASGGELSRFMLALRVALFNNAPKRTVIFDEIDVGISGSVADSIGQRLKILSQALQIIVITHQPQVAGKADLHILVEKSQREKYTIATVRILDYEARALELARMISGKVITETAIKAAKELLI
ncbi:MAG: DNA repair protein RecN [Rickettsiales bacterium]|nr:MAG: DNA repair protein RecN [Rickettsiales bacterium]